MVEARNIRDIADLRLQYDLAIYNCQRFGTYEALVYEDPQLAEPRRYTNVEIAREAVQLAAGLRALGIETGDRVMVMIPNCPEVIISYQAIARAGAIVIPVLPLLKPPEVQYIAQNSGARLLITSPLLLPLHGTTLAQVPTLEQIVCVGDLAAAGPLGSLSEGRPQVHTYQDVLARGAEYADYYLSDLPGINLTPDDTAVILYTSGTTGRPKGVMLSHRNLVANAVSGRGVGGDEDPSVAESQGETHLAILPLAHAFGLVASNVAYLNGARIVMLPRFDTTAVFSAIERYRVSGFAGVPAMFVALLHSPDADRYDTSSLQYCVSGSAPLPVAVLEAFEQKFGCRILEGYGLSEATAALTGHNREMPRKPGSVGKPLPGVEIRIVDENDRDVPVGEVGEIIARGPNVMQQYYNLPEETATAMRNGWLHTGDMGRMDEDGYIYVVERKKDLIIRGGFNIYPRDVEEVLNRHPAVIESAVVGIPSERMGEEVKAFVVTREPVDAEALKAFCREYLANYKTPSEIEFVDSLPRNLVGKIDKKELRRRYVQQPS
ncbi:MAG: long-chain fatty acid--CoA ligase [Thermogemmatispora sp.]|jgi:long-chain acyl-CoA synthetase|uniref:Long-chain-fatty-acid--CoA ligase n=1 Tax=Thermogemmatispora aurantia TaxID=2045279 RepID=A0A5J4K7T7_9CHLR|nr:MULTISPECIES: long-chain fatty acid--CoA ligase [Thermogemmatispora]MBE3565122.1 long-chain fatty acid--CoA ligase [Thermogemmatispora sp.]GER82769.1 long-chain-fatty-acid--CoA ligase [Thermogemmatispora aurantia]